MSEISSPLDAILFDLDGVLVSTDEFHYRAWKEMADKAGIYFDRKINERLRGVSRMASLEIILERAGRPYSDAEKQRMATAKNDRYRALIAALTPNDLLPGVPAFLAGVKQAGLKTAVASSSKNTDLILERVGLRGEFDTVVTGNDITHSKPDPEVFLMAAARLNVPPRRCLVIEDAFAGIEAAVRGGMRSLGVGFAAGCPQAELTASGLDAVSVPELLSKLGQSR